MRERKLRLAMDDLRVETFEMERSAREHGTVHAHGNPDSATAMDWWGCACGTVHANTCGTCQETFAVTCPPDPACGTTYETSYLTCGDPTCQWGPDGVAILC